MASSDGTAQDFAFIPDDVADAGRYVQLVAESLVNGLNSLDTDISALLGSWKGTSADAYSVGWTEAKQGAETVLEALQDMAELLGVTSQAFTHQDQLSASDTTALSSSLDLPGM
ncbi:WXG100 family type VII secretion target [Nocardia aurea]|uniref:WXG100 family type VII secretion target n=1 Tax=Nocardia aurea TaxID=2144174 RepID=A0ABV3FT43_9NOCA|nr:WXG100 family type VII secretion target [Planctomycetaceae bacterium]